MAEPNYHYCITKHPIFKFLCRKSNDIKKYFFIDIENIIHFSIGRNIEDKDTSSISIKIPNIYDIVKILGIMILFSILQGVFTYLFDEIL